MVTSKDERGNIFLTMENLAFAMPLILLCGGYAYLKYIPLQYGLPAVGLVVGVLFLQSQMQAQKNAKLEHLDEGMIKELAGDDDEGDDGQEKVAQTKQSKAKAQVERRLAAEKKKASTKSTNGKKKKGSKGDDGGDEDDDDDEDALMTFAKGSREKQKKR